MDLFSFVAPYKVEPIEKSDEEKLKELYAKQKDIEAKIQKQEAMLMQCNKDIQILENRLKINSSEGFYQPDLFD